MPDRRKLDFENFLRRVRCGLPVGRTEYQYTFDWNKERSDIFKEQLKDMRASDIVNLNDAELENIDLSGACLKHAQLREANLTEAQLRRAKLQYADLTDADLTDAQANSIYLQNAFLRNANFTNTSLRGAYLSNAFFGGADLCGADLHKAQVKNTTFSGVRTDDTTQYPEKIEEAFNSRTYPIIRVPRVPLNSNGGRYRRTRT